MRLSPKTHQTLETFYRQYFNDEELILPPIEIYLRNGAKLLTNLIKVDGITIGRHIFINPRVTKFDKENRLCISKNLLSHEVAHVIQYQQFGFFGFLFKYLKDYFNNLKQKNSRTAEARLDSYWEIPHEIEARDASAKFVKWLRINKV